MTRREGGLQETDYGMIGGRKNVRGLKRFGAISRILFRHGFGGLVDRVHRRRPADAGAPPDGVSVSRPGIPTPDRLRRLLEDLGPSFIKLGQLLSTRADVFPPEYIEAFRKLQDAVPPEPFETVRATIEAELETPLEQLFESFNELPDAAASVAQVHTARLPGGTEVAVKVIRAGIDALIRDDIRVMYYFARKIERAFELGRILGAENLVREFERTVFRELDMTIEAGNIDKFANHFRHINEIHITKVYWELVSPSVLVMERIAGVKVDQVEAIRAMGIDPQTIAMIGLRSLSRQMMEFGYFHADPHPGNTLVMPDGRVSLVDFGIVGYLDEEMMRHIANVLLGYAEHDYDLIMDALIDVGLLDEEKMDLKAFRVDLKDLSESFYGRSLRTITVKEVYDQVMQLVLAYQVRMPRNLLLLFKTLIQTEALGKILGSDASIIQVMKPYARDLIRRSYEGQRLFRDMERDLHHAAGYLRSVPRMFYDILRTAARGKHRLEFGFAGFNKASRQFERGVNRLVVGMVISASTIAGSLILNSKQTVFELSFFLFGPQTITLTALLGITGYVIATILGVWLILSIYRSGKL
jgi:ubiquinone biosynthesis protein